MEDQFVSVIVPVYNGERYLAQALRSVLDQSYRAIEVIVVDDGSSDASASVAAHFGNSIRYHRIPHAGPAAARNQGVRAARGVFLSFLDADDTWDAKKLALQMALCGQDQTLDMCFTYVRQFLDPALSPRSGEETRFLPQPGYHCSSIVVKKESFLRVGFFDEQWRTGEFIDWYVRAKNISLKEGMVEQVLVNRRVHDRNFTRGQGQAAQDYARILKKIIAQKRINRQ